MPMHAEMMASMVKKYGKEKAKKIYYAIENKKKGKKQKIGKKQKKTDGAEMMSRMIKYAK